MTAPPTERAHVAAAETVVADFTPRFLNVLLTWDYMGVSLAGDVTDSIWED